MKKVQIKRLFCLLLCVTLMMSNMVFADAASTAPAKYNDIAGNKYEAQLREWIGFGFINGYPDGSFKPANNITRSEFMALTNRAFGFSDTVDIKFSDVNSKQWFYKDAAKAVKAGFIQGANGKLMPLENITRQEMAVILSRLTKKEAAAADETVIKNLTDSKEIPAWSKAAISTSMKAGFFAGFVDKSFKPTEKITRLEAVVALDRAYKSVYKAVYTIKDTYGPQSGTQTLDGDVAVIAPDVTLRNTVINGNLVLRETIGDGNMTLDNVVVKGETIIKGGGANSIHINNSTLGKVTVIREGNTIRIVAAGSTSIGTVNIGSGAKLEEENLTGAGFGDVVLLDDIPEGANVIFEGTFGDVKIDSPKINVSVEKGSVGSMTLAAAAEDTKINLGQQAIVTTMTLNAAAQVTGTGSIGTANINATGTVIAQKPTVVNTAPNVTAQVAGAPVSQPQTPVPSTGGGTPGGGNNGGGDNTVTLGKPANATRTADDIRARWDKVNYASGYILKTYKGSISSSNLVDQREVSLQEYQDRIEKASGYGLFRIVAEKVSTSGAYIFTVAAKGTGNYRTSEEAQIGAPVQIAVATDAASLDTALNQTNTATVLVAYNNIDYKINGEYKEFVRPSRITIAIGHDSDPNNLAPSAFITAKNFTSADGLDFAWYSIGFNAYTANMVELNAAFHGFAGSIIAKVPGKEQTITLYPSGNGFVEQNGNVHVGVADIDSLRAALDMDSEIDVISLLEDITGIPETIEINRPIILNGQEHKLSFTNGARLGLLINTDNVILNDLTVEMAGSTGWQGNYAVQAYKADNVVINNYKGFGGDAALLVNGSKVILTGHIDVSGNEFGGIEVSKGQGVTTEPQLIANEASFVNTTEEHGKPTIWEDGVSGKVKGFRKTPILIGTQPQYYLNFNTEAEADYNKTAALGTWTKDRTAPKSWEEKDGWITYTTSKQQASNSWYDWQGRGASTHVGLTDQWKVESQIDLTDELLNGTGVRTSLWIQVDGVNGAENTQNNVLDWSILQYKNDPTNQIKGWESWDGTNGVWLPIEGVAATKGIHTLTTIYNAGKMSQFIDGTLVREYMIETDEGYGGVSTPSYLILQSRTFGQEYTAKWKVPTVAYVNQYSAETKFISNIDQLKAAIKNQKDNQTWILSSGTYDLPRDTVTQYSGQTGWYMPITANNLTIIGNGNPVITSSEVSTNGAWASQNLITVWGDNVTLKGLTITPKVEINKSVEVVGNKKFTVENCTFTPNTVAAGTSDTKGGSLYFNGNGETGNKEILIKNNTFHYTSVAFDGVEGSNITITGNTFANIASGAYAVGNTYWGSAERKTIQYADVKVNGNHFNNVIDATKLIAARLNQTFILDGSNQINGAVIDKFGFGKYINFNNLAYWIECKDNKVVVDGKTYESPYKDTAAYVTTVAQLKAAITAAKAGDKILIAAGDYNITETINVNKAITLKGAEAYGTKISTSGGNPVFTLSAAAAIDGISIDKTDKANQHLITITAKDAVVKNSKFTGQYQFGDNEVARAIVPNAGITGYVIDNNHFENLRQPAYLEGAGVVSNNFIKNTRGWVVCVNHEIEFTGNSFENNAVDIAIIANNQTASENYSDVEAISAANNGAYVQNQLTGISAKNGETYNTVSIGNGASAKYFSTINAAIAAAVPGDIIQASPGVYNEDVIVNKAVSIKGAGADASKIVATTGNTAPLTFAADHATVEGFTITHAYTAAELAAWNFNNNGVTFNQGKTGNTLQNCTVSLNRNGIYLNNCQGNSVIGNLITNNRTGINMTNDIGSTTIASNTVKENWTIGLVYYTQSSGGNLDTVTIENNLFDQNWYTEILVKNADKATGTLDVTHNTFTDDPVTYSTDADESLNEPGFAEQKPNVDGIEGNAVKPEVDLPTLRIYNSGSVLLNYGSLTPNLAMPQVNYNEGTYWMFTPMLELSVPFSGYTIYYTTDGSDPKSSGTRQPYTEKMSFDVDTLLRAVSCKDGVYSGELRKQYDIRKLEISHLTLEEGYDFETLEIPGTHLPVQGWDVSITIGKYKEVEDHRWVLDEAFPYNSQCENVSIEENRLTADFPQALPAGDYSMQIIFSNAAENHTLTITVVNGIWIRQAAAQDSDQKSIKAQLQQPIEPIIINEVNLK